MVAAIGLHHLRRAARHPAAAAAGRGGARRLLHPRHATHRRSTLRSSSAWCCRRCSIRAAVDFSFVSFMRRLSSILNLGVALVIVTAVAVGLVAGWALPGLLLPAALILGAVVAPPDAVSAVAIGGKLGSAQPDDDRPQRREPDQRRGGADAVQRGRRLGHRWARADPEPLAVFSLRQRHRHRRRSRHGFSGAPHPAAAHRHDAGYRARRS